MSEPSPYKIPLVLNIIPQDKYEEIGEERLKGELSDQLFLTTGDATSERDVEGLPGQVIYCTPGGGLGPGNILVNGSNVCNSESDLTSVLNGSGQVPDQSLSENLVFPESE